MASDNNSVLPDVLIASAALSIYAAYHMVLGWMTLQHPIRTTIGHNHINRAAWCRMISGKSESGILAVQSLRNGMMASQLLANTAFAILSALTVIFINTGYYHAQPYTPITYAGLHNHPIAFLSNQTVMPGIKLFLLVLTFLISFFFYILSMRAYYHATFLITITPEYGQGRLSPEYITRILNRGALMHTIGTRTFYAAFLVLLWMFGPIPMAAVTLILVWMLYTTDYLPKSNQNAQDAQTMSVETSITET